MQMSHLIYHDHLNANSSSNFLTQRPHQMQYLTMPSLFRMLWETSNSTPNSDESSF